MDDRRESGVMSIRLDGRVSLGAFDLEIDLTIHESEVVVVIGPNGSGKSTLLRTIAGLQSLDSGSLIIDDVVVDGPTTGVFAAARRRNTGLVFQSGALFENLTVIDNVVFALRARGIGRRDATARVANLISELELDGLLERRPSQLSGGQRQRVEIARALAATPRVLLFDEPTSSLDEVARRGFRDLFRTSIAQRVAYRVIVSHDRDEVRALADRVVVLESGRVVWDGRVSDEGWMTA